MDIDAAAADPVKIYQALVDLVIPRPIAWVTTIDAAGRVNLAPFSFFNTFGANPPIVVFSPTLRRNGTKKDTLLNLEAVPEFVVNASVHALASAVNLTSTELPLGESEADLAGLELKPSTRVRPPFVALAPARLECRVRMILPMGTGPIAPNLVIGEVVWISVDDRLLTGAGRVDPQKLDPIARLGSDFYCRAGDIFELKRP